MTDEPFDNDDEERGPSRSQRKRDSEALQVLGERLLRLSAEQLAAIPLPDELRDAVDAARAIHQHGARRRQLQYIGKVMRRVDAEPIQEALDRVHQHDAQAAARQHRLERWRDRLLEEGDEVLTELLNAHPQADRQHLRQLVRGAKAEQAAGKPPRMARELFRYLRELIESE